MAEMLLEKFLISTDSPFLDEINIVIVMKCIPTKIVDYSSSLINLSILQSSLIAHKNNELVDAFGYVDEKNKKRVIKIKDLIEAQQIDLNQVTTIMDEVKKFVAHNDDILEEFEGVWRKMHEPLP